MWRAPVHRPGPGRRPLLWALALCLVRMLGTVRQGLTVRDGTVVPLPDPTCRFNKLLERQA